MPIDKPGSYKISFDEYLADPCVEPSLTRGIARDLLFKSPLHAFANHPRLNPLHKEDEKEDKFSIGQAAHSLFLEGINKMWVVNADDWRKKEAKEAKAEALKMGMIPLLAKQADAVREMVEIAINRLKKSELSGIFDGGDSELSYVWQEGGLWLRCRLDKINKGRDLILDYKTSKASVNPEDFLRIILSHNYDMQEAFYRRGVKAVEGTSPKFVFMAQEVEYPYACSFIALSPAFQAMADQKVIRAINLWEICMAKNDWPGYPQRVAWLELPPWATNWEMRATFLGEDLEDL
jgi:hypothetical protein